MKKRSIQKSHSFVETVAGLSHRYLCSDIHEAHSALVEMEKLLRAHIGVPSSKFALGMTIAKRSDIVFHLGDREKASSIMEDALQIFRAEPMARYAGLLTSDAVLKFIRKQDAESNVKWRQNIPHA